MYLKKIEDGERSKTFTERVVGAVVPERWSLIKEIEGLAKQSELKIATTDKNGASWGLKSLNEQELKSITRLLKKIAATSLKGIDAAIYFGQLMQGDVVNIDEVFYSEVSAQNLYLYDEKLKKYHNEIDLLRRNHALEIETFKKEVELLNANLDMYKERSDRKSIALKLLLEGIEKLDKELTPYVSIKRNYDKEIDALLVVDRKYGSLK